MQLLAQNPAQRLLVDRPARQMLAQGKVDEGLIADALLVGTSAEGIR